MKRILITLLIISAGIAQINAQSPASFKYQAVVRDAAGVILTNQAVGMRMTILQGSASGSISYQETFTPTSNTYGLVNLSIGQGTVTSGTFAGIDWSAGPYFIETAMDPTGGASYTVMGASQLLSVPYALFATDVENDSDEQTMTFNNTTGDLTISSGNTVTLPMTAGGDNWGSQVVASDATLTGDGSSSVPLSVSGDLTDDQNLTLAANSLSIDNGNAIDLSSYLDNTDAQSLSFSGTSLSISNGNTVDLSTLQDGVIDADADPTNEHNTNLLLSGTTLNLIDGGGTLTADLSSLQDGVNDADADPANEIQTLSISGNALSISGANTVTIGGGNTLDEAYDQGGAGLGRIITVDAGEVELTTSTGGGIALRATNSNTGVGILTSTTSAANSFSAFQSSTNSSSTIASAIVGNTDGAAWGVSGQASAISGATAAVYGSNLRTVGGHGVLGVGVNGVVGQTNYQTGFGTYGQNFDLIAPLGNAVGAYGVGYVGVWGDQLGTGGPAIHANGDLSAAGVKTFKIDHPSDPENKYLKHFSIESNEVLNMYRGIATFDANGETIIEMPSYFDEININFSYHLTPIGSYAPLFIKSKMENRKFVVAGGSPGDEVSWTVYAERNDPYVQQNPDRKKVEEEKESWNKGKYLMPELYNQSADKKIVKPLEKVEQKEMNIKR
jgi:hypothetical protein